MHMGALTFIFQHSWKTGSKPTQVGSSVATMSGLAVRAEGGSASAVARGGWAMTTPHSAGPVTQRSLSFATSLLHFNCI